MQLTTLLVFVVLSLSQAAVIKLQAEDIVQTAISNGHFKTLVTALTAADLVTALKGPGPFTVFAPTDDAFNRLPPGAIEELLRPENKQLLIKILTYHVVGGKALTAAEILAMKPPFRLKMLNGMSTNITTNGSSIKIDRATVIIANVMCSNGIIHAIDEVIFPPDIVRVAIEDGRFKTLVFALEVTDLVRVLSSPGPFTVFAPTDAAFAKLPPGVLDDLLRPENRLRLIRILLYHVVYGRTLTAADIIALKPPFRLEMLNGFSTQITEAGGKIKVNDATVIVADVLASNGIVHGIDTVLFPED